MRSRNGKLAILTSNATCTLSQYVMGELVLRSYYYTPFIVPKREKIKIKNLFHYSIFNYSKLKINQHLIFSTLWVALIVVHNTDIAWYEQIPWLKPKTHKMPSKIIPDCPIWWSMINQFCSYLFIISKFPMALTIFKLDCLLDADLCFIQLIPFFKWPITLIRNPIIFIEFFVDFFLSIWQMWVQPTPLTPSWSGRGRR